MTLGIMGIVGIVGIVGRLQNTQSTHNTHNTHSTQSTHNTHIYLSLKHHLRNHKKMEANQMILSTSTASTAGRFSSKTRSQN